MTYQLGRLLLFLVIGLLSLALPGNVSAESEGPRPTRLEIRPIDSVTVGDKLIVTVQLTLESGELAGAIDNEALELLVDGVRERRVRTNQLGMAEIPIRSQLTIGTHIITVVYGGSSSLLASEASVEFIVAPAVLEIQIIPALPDIVFSLGDHEFKSGADGIARVEVEQPGLHQLEVLTTEVKTATTIATFSRWRDEAFDPIRDVRIPAREPLQVGFDITHLVSWTFVDLDGELVDPSRISSMTIKGTHGVIHTFHDSEPQWVKATRTVRLRNGLEEAKIQWGVESVVIDGANTVNQGQHRFYVSPNDNWQIKLLLYTAHFRARDALFGFPIGSGFTLQSPDGQTRFLAGGPDRQVSVTSLARGHYLVTVANAPGMAPPAPVAVTREQDVHLKVISYLDMAVAFIVLASVGLGLLFLGRPQILELIPNPLRRIERLDAVWTTAILLLVLFTVPILTAGFVLTVRQVPDTHGITADPANSEFEVVEELAIPSAAADDTGREPIEGQMSRASTYIEDMGLIGSSLTSRITNEVLQEASELVPIPTELPGSTSELSVEPTPSPPPAPAPDPATESAPATSLSELVFSVSPGGAAVASSAQDPIPVLAYYYIWFTTGSWDRAKTDYPLLGRYSSDDRAVMEQHVQQAKQAGIDGFIVSWKSTEPLNRRLEQLVEIANEQNFKLAIIYQGLDFERNPLPIDRIAGDLDYFIDTYGDNPAFDLFELPVVIWSGTWEFSPSDVQAVTDLRRDDLLILASERSVADYRRLAHLVDGNAYYWSSVDPQTSPIHREKLAAMAAAVHQRGGLWIAPAAPGFDARLIGGRRVIDRRDGETLRQQMDAALSSGPDVIGIISWNEFSENTHIEPSENYGTRALTILAEIHATTAPEILEFDSSEPSATDFDIYRLLVLGCTIAIFLTSFTIVFRRQAHDRKVSSDESTPSETR